MHTNTNELSRPDTSHTEKKLRLVLARAIGIVVVTMLSIACGSNGGDQVAPDANAPPMEMCDDGVDNDGDGDIDCDDAECDCQSAVCGDGVRQSGEACDEGGVDSASCDSDCTAPMCGDAHVNPAAGEACDDGGMDSASCDSDCTTPLCGDAHINRAAGEQCDDGDNTSADFCTSSCEIDHNRYGILVAGLSHTCVLLDNGSVRCWGQGTYGQLGYGNTDHIGDDETPASAGDVDVGGTVVQLAAGSAHTCALLDTGSVRCWGSGEYGRLGYGNTESIGDDETPASADDVDVGGTVIQLAAGSGYTCALLATGSVRCWGYGASLGYGSSSHVGDDETPASMGDVDIGGSVVQLVTGRGHTCALLATGSVRCWGLNFNGQLGYGHTEIIGDDETPASAGDVVLGGSAIQLAAGYHSGALLDNGSVRCWGGGLSGALGYGNVISIGDDETPASAGDVDVGGTVVQLVADQLHTCALLDNGSVRCWGSNMLGYGNTDVIGDNETPASAGDVDLGGSVALLAAGGNHTCAVMDTGSVRCWGRGGWGALGYGNIDHIGDDETPASAGDVPVL